MGEHGPAGDLMKDLWPRGAHSGAFARSKNDGKTRTKRRPGTAFQRILTHNLNFSLDCSRAARGRCLKCYKEKIVNFLAAIAAASSVKAKLAG
jgi:hypothetical protein